MATKNSTASNSNDTAAPSNAPITDVVAALTYLTATSRFEGVLFNIVDKRADGPAMSGLVTVDGRRVGVSGFMKAPEGKKRYLSLSIGEEGMIHYYGNLFRIDDKHSDSSPDYSGYVKTLPCDGGTDYTAEEWDAAPQLQVFGWKRRSSDGTARIALTVSPRTVDDSELPF